MVIDVAENVVECRALDCSPFPIENKRTHVEVPKVEVPDSLATHAYEAFGQDIEALERHWACWYTTDSTTGERLDSKKKRVAVLLLEMMQTPLLRRKQREKMSMCTVLLSLFLPMT